MAYDEDLAERIRDHLAGEEDLSERKMFGGLAFLLGGHMAVAAVRRGGAMVRVDPAEADDLLEVPGVEQVVMRDRPMTGWLEVPAAQLGTEEQLAAWVDRGRAYVRTLPPKG